MADSVGERVFAIHLLLEGAVGRRVSQGEIGVAVAEELGRDHPYAAASVSEWENGVGVPDVRVIAALARACLRFGVEVDPGWLAFGAESYAPAPVNLTTVLSRPVSSVVRSKRARRLTQHEG